MFKKKVLVLFIIIYALVGNVSSALAEEVQFTSEEKYYIRRAPVLKVVSIDGIAPLSYVDSKGKVKGIGISVLDKVSDITGLVFEYRLYQSVADALQSDFDLYVNAEKAYAPADMVLSEPYLESKTILYINSSVDPNDLDNKTFAAVMGGSLPEGIKAENALFFNDREEAINAVELGKADYGFGNEYSLAFYMLQNDYHNVVMIPTSKEKRQYRVGLSDGNSLLLSVINKSIEAINQNEVQAMILEVASRVERKITVGMVMEAYGEELLGVVAVVVTILLYSVVSSTRAKNRFKMEYKRHMILSSISDECLFEYQVGSGLLELSDRFREKFDIRDKTDEVINLFINAIGEHSGSNSDVNIYTIRLPVPDADVGVFKVISSNLKDESGNVYSILGKLMDISEEEREREKLISKSQLDGLTSLYNATTTREIIVANMKDKPREQMDVLLIIDCDKFKAINDNYGHLKGDLALENISRGLRLTFRQTDVMGRIGGDEFCVYLANIPSADFVNHKCLRFMGLIQKLNKAFPIAVSIGVAIYKEHCTYEDLFTRADDALYRAKEKGGAQIVIYNEDETKGDHQTA